MVLSVWMGDQSDEDRIGYASRLNPTGIVERFAEELEAALAAFSERIED